MAFGVVVHGGVGGAAVGEVDGLRVLGGGEGEGGEEGEEGGEGDGEVHFESWGMLIEGCLKGLQ